MDVREMIEGALQSEGVLAAEWREGEDGLEAVLDGVWEVVEDDDSRGLVEGDQGKVAACVLGTEQYRNQRVAFHFTPEGYDAPEEVLPSVDVEQVA